MMVAPHCVVNPRTLYETPVKGKKKKPGS